MNIKIRDPASILLHGCTSNLQTSTRSLTCPGRKREENSGIRGAFSCKSGQRGPLFSAARLCATDIATNFSLRPKLLYTPRLIHHVSVPRYSSSDNGAGDGSRTPISWRNRFSRRTLAVHPFRGGARSFGLEFEPLPLRIPEKALNNWKLSSFPDR